MKHPQVIWLALGMALRLSAAAVGAEFKPQTDHPAPLPKVFDVDRPNSTDMVVLDTGQKLSGTVLNKTLQIRTYYGPLTLEKRWVAGISLAAGSGAIECLITVNGNQLTGFVDTPNLLLPA